MPRVINALEQVLDNNGNPLIAGQLFFYESGSSTTVKTTYSDASETIPNANPVILGADGRCPDVWGSGTYRVIIKDRNDVQIELIDPVGGTINTGLGSDWNATEVYSESDVRRYNDRYWYSNIDSNQDNIPNSLSLQWTEVITRASPEELFINGGFDFWDYATSQTTSGYGSDNRFENLNTGSTKVHTQQAFTLGQTDVAGNPEFYSRTVVTSVAGAANFCKKQQKIESVTRISGEPITLSFYAKADSAKNIGLELSQIFGTGGSPSATVTGIGAQKIALTTAWARYSVTITVPSVAGKTLGTGDNDCLAAAFWFDAGSDFNAMTDTLGQQSGTFEVANLSFKRGCIDMPSQPRSKEIEKALCQRYYVNLGDVIYHVGYIPSANSVYRDWKEFPVTMRGVPATTGILIVQLGLYNSNPAYGGGTIYGVSYRFTGLAAGTVPAFANYKITANAEL